MNKNKIILVIGMHRSGTSATAGVIELLGGKIGQKMPATKYNQKGHFENHNFYKINDKILQSIGNSWDNISDITNEKLHLIPGSLQQELKKLIKLNVNMNYPFLLKDPRICALYPLYERIFDELKLQVFIVQVKRDKEEIIKSLMNRDKYTFDKCDKMIDDYYRCIKDFVRENVIANFTFEELLNDSNNLVKEIVKQIPILNMNGVQPKIDRFLDSNLKHFNATIKEDN